MKKFRFALEPVLEQRRRIEETKQQIVSQRVLELQKAEDDLSELHGQYSGNSERLRDGHQHFSTEDLRLYYAHLEYLDRAITTQHAIVAQRKSAVEKARVELLQATKERKAVEKLKERKHTEWAANAARLEQNELDDSNARRFVRAQFSGGYS
ncbi:MAG: flagellar export protein FliJ [Candidatus Eremiobacteraeota bacterium]|nr:flagellar export protein FliJ [Candidatus Eremiobacteraeota bacterium]